MYVYNLLRPLTGLLLVTFLLFYSLNPSAITADLKSCREFELLNDVLNWLIKYEKIAFPYSCTISVRILHCLL